MGRLTVLVLGSAAGGGFPQWNCRCATCRLAWAGDARVRPRTQASLAVSADGENWLLINASPDLPQQVRQSKVLHPRSGTRGSPIKAVVLTGAEIDQVAGLLSLREREPLMVCATPATLAALADNAMFGVLAADVVRRMAAIPGVPLMLPGEFQSFGLEHAIKIDQISLIRLDRLRTRLTLMLQVLQKAPKPEREVGVEVDCHSVLFGGQSETKERLI